METNIIESYQDFLKTKQTSIVRSGFEVGTLNSLLFPFQSHCVKKALKAGKYALFQDCGLGKTFEQLEWAYRVLMQTKKPVLILAPLAVSGQTIQEGHKFGIRVIQYHKNVDDRAEIYITNYDQLDNIDCSIFSGIVLDESSILKNFEGALRNQIIEKFRDTPYKLACTATPSPNDPMELGNHAEFLNVMGRNQMLSMFFVHDGGETAKWRLKGHAEKDFYRWVGSWSSMLSNPADIGFPMEGYDLPKLNYFEYCIKTDKRDNGRLFNDALISATNFNQELRLTRTDRIAKVVEIVNSSEENYIIWIKHNEEGEILRKLIPGAVEVKGSDDKEYKEKHLLGFANNEFRVLITKSKIAQFGLNYQNCRNQIFAALDFSFESLYQSIRRSYRFGQKNEVNIHLITTDTMENVMESIKQKQKNFEIMQKEITETINEGKQFQAHASETLVIENDWFKIYRGDCVKLIQQIPDESIGFSVFSPPFPEIYTYSNYIEDMGNTTFNTFGTGFNFLAKELFRVIKSGRNVSVHCMDLPIQKGKEGFIGLRDFSNMIREQFEAAGFIYHSRVTIWKNPVTEMQRTKALGLLHKQVKKDSTMSRVGIPDYVMTFRKDGDRSDPVKCTINVDTWQKWASPVWMDIDYGNTLQYTTARDDNDEKHICPLQLDTIERLIGLYSNPGDTIYTPFGGIGSEGYQAVKMGRKAILNELKDSYIDIMVKNMNAVTLQKNQATLFV